MYTPASAANNFIATNEGKCVTYGTGADAVAKCNCTKGALNPTLNPPRMVGQISLMDEPMVSDLSYEKQFTTVTYASAGGGAMFAISESVCKDDANGVVCSGRGQCLADGSCNCNDGAGGPTCENVCPQATDEDETLLARLGLVENVAGLNCAGHGTCDPITAECICDSEFFGPRCTYICRRDANMKICSGNGTCVYNPETSSSPYCECDRFQDPGECMRSVVCSSILKVGAASTVVKPREALRAVSSPAFAATARVPPRDASIRPSSSSSCSPPSSSSSSATIRIETTSRKSSNVFPRSSERDL